LGSFNTSNLRCVNGRSQTQRAAEPRWTWIEFLPDDLWTLRRLKYQRALDTERVVVEGHIDRLLVKSRCHQRGVVGILGLPDIDR
jgi:hypothetical protein